MSKSKRSRYGPSSSSSSILLACEELKKSLKKKSSSASAIPQEVVVEILRRLPLESLHRFKWVSKLEWFPLITREVLPRLVPRFPLLGFFDNASEFYSLPQQPPTPFDHTLRSLHPESRFRRSIVDSCNGLLLLFGFWGRGRQSAFYLVCNPFTGSWTEIPALVDHAVTRNFNCSYFYNWPSHCILDFDPWASSPHYNIVTIFFGWDKPAHPVSLHVYNSATGRWWRRDFGGLVVHLYSSNRQYRTVWDGAVYILCHRGGSWDESFQIARFDGLRGLTTAADGTNDDANLEFIDFPRGVRMQGGPHGMCIATSGGKLFLAYFDCDLLQLRVWSLLALRLHNDDARRNKYEWVMEHEITLSALIGGGGRCRQRDWKELRVVGFHPVTEAIFILHDGVLFMYDLRSARLDKHLRVPKWLYLTMSLFPFSPCSLDLLENRNQHQH